MPKDNGHDNLIQDIKDLLSEAKDYEFHDFKNTNHAMPKIALMGKLNAMRDNLEEGRYDNTAP